MSLEDVFLELTENTKESEKTTDVQEKEMVEVEENEVLEETEKEADSDESDL